MRAKSSYLGFRTTPEVKEAIERIAKAQGLSAGQWMHAVVEKAVKSNVLVRQQVTYEVIEPKTTLRAAESAKRYP